MPTLPPDRTPLSDREPHEHRGMAEWFGTDAERYDRARPRYPDAMVEAIVAACPGPDLLDVGCGTGISARHFQAAGCRVLGVDVDARMAAFARDAGLEVEVATFEDWDPTGRTFDAVTAGQAWHWVDPAAGAAKAARVLRPGGRLALFWNVLRLPADVAEAFGAVYARVVPDAPAYQRMASVPDAYSTFLTKAADGIRGTGAFGEPEEWRFDWERHYGRDEWLDHVPTGGDASRFSSAQLEELMAGLGTAIDGLGGGFTAGYTAAVVTAARTGA